MKAGLNIFLANIPTLFCAGIGGLLADHGHPGFGVALLVLAFMLAHSVKSADE